MTKHIILLLMLICCIGWVEGATCLSDLSNMPCNLTRATPVLDAGLDLQCPTDDCFIINESGSYNLNGAILHGNDTDQDGAIILNKNNILVYNVTLIGNLTLGSKSMMSSLVDNITIKYGNFYNYSTGLRINNGNYINIINNNIYNTIRDGFLVYGNYNLNFSDNYAYSIEGFTSGGGYSGINMKQASSRKNINATISRNSIVGFDQSFYCQNGTNIIISNNVFNRSLINSVQMGCNNSIVSNNKIYNATRNGISVDDIYINVSDNFIKDMGHGGIDLYDIDENDRAEYARIWNNNITTLSTLNEPQAGIYICNSSSHTIFNNRIINMYNTQTTDVSGIKSGCDITQTYNNNVYNNTIINISRTCLYVTDNNASYSNNTLQNCGYEHDIQLRSGDNGDTFRMNYFFDNIFIEGIAKYWQTLYRNNATINETSSIYHLINLSNNGTLLSLYNGRKDIVIKNNTITINSLPRNMSLFNLSTGTPVFISNLNKNPNYQLTLGSNEQYEIDDCVTPYENITLTTSTTFCKGTYLLNDTEGDGSIKLSGDNGVLDCNSAYLKGNKSSISTAITIVYGDSNWTIKNCIINDYFRAINSNDKVTILNNTFVNATNQNIRFGGGADNSLIENNTFLNSGNNNFIIQGAENGTFRNNLINSINTTESGTSALYFETGSNGWVISYNTFINRDPYTIRGKNNTIKNNLVTNLDDSLYGGLISSSQNITVENEHYQNGRVGFIVSNSSYIYLRNITIYNETTSSGAMRIVDSNNVFINEINSTLNDIGFSIENSSYVTLNNSNIIESNTLYDDFGTGIRIEKQSSFITVSNTLIKDYASSGIIIRQSSNITIDNNDFEQLSISDKLSMNIYDKYEVTCAICAIQKYKGFFDGSPLPSDNITISGNTFDSDVQTYLRLEGTTNVNHDLTNYWYRKFQVTGYSNQTGVDEFYNSNSYSALSNIPLSTSISENYIFFKSGIETSGASGHTVTNYSISTTRLLYKNTNNTNDINLSLFNLTDQPDSKYSQIYYSNQSSPIIENINEYNITVEPGNRTLVFTFESSNQPVFDSVGIGISDITYSYENNILTINCTGTGSIGLTNMTLLLERLGINYDYYVHRQDGVLVDYTKGDTYTMTSCSSHTFYGENPKLSYTSPQAYNILTDVLAVILAVALLIFAAAPVIGNPNWDMKQYMNYYIFVLIATILIGVLIQYIFDV